MREDIYIEAINLEKRFREVIAIHDANVQIHKNELFGFIGPDGAGKTTLFRMMVTLLLPTAGSIRIGEYDVVKDYRLLRRIIGYMPGTFSLYADLSVHENLEFFATIFGTTIKANYEIIEPIYNKLAPFSNRKAGNLSGGMKQKLALCCSLIHKPDILILDEPTTGVDAISRKEFWDILQDLRKIGVTILVSTPYMDEAVRCERVALMNKGQILTIDQPANITRSFPWPLYNIKAVNIYQLIEDLKEYPATHSVYPFGQYVHLATKEKVDPDEVRKFLTGRGHENIDMSETWADIEDSFMEQMWGG